MKTFFLPVLLLLLATPAFAVEGCKTGTCSSCHTLSVKEANDFLKNVGEVKKVAESPVKGLWELTLEKDGRQGIILMDFAKKYVMPGPLFPLDSPQIKNPPQKKVEKTDPAKIPLEYSLVMGNEKAKKRLFVFTDPDCPYCARFHETLKELVKTDPEVAVYVKLFPLPMHPNAYDKSRKILASKSLDLLDRAFRGESLPKPQGDEGKEGIDANLFFGNSVGINGTPTLILSDGTIAVGGRDLDTLKKMVNEAEGKK